MQTSEALTLCSIEDNKCAMYCILILFSAPCILAAAGRVLSKERHVLHNAELSVRKPASKDPCRLLLRGINPSTSTEMIELYVENMMAQEDFRLYPSPATDLILIHFAEPISKGLLTAFHLLKTVFIFHQSPKMLRVSVEPPPGLFSPLVISSCTGCSLSV